MTPLKKVLIFGGTHGNEWTGIFAVKKYAASLKSLFPELDLHFILANPVAFEMNLRFKDEDLNRAFQYLNEDRPDSYEHNRAREIKALIDEGPCFVVDLHTTTSNMGNTVVVAHDFPYNFQVASELSLNLPDTRVIVSPDPHRKYLVSQSDFGIMIEVGPVANGLIDPNVLTGTLELLKGILNSLSRMNKLPTGELEVFEEIENIHYPQSESGELTAYIHPSFQGLDFHPIKGSYTPFRSFNDEDIQLKTEEVMYPIFINEAAYYKTAMAFTLCQKKTLRY